MAAGANRNVGRMAAVINEYKGPLDAPTAGPAHPDPP